MIQKPSLAIERLLEHHKWNLAGGLNGPLSGGPKGMCGKWQADNLEGPCHEWSKEKMYLAPVRFCSQAICLPHFSPHSMLTTNFLYCKLFFMKVIRLLSRFWCQPCSSAPSPHATHMHTHAHTQPLTTQPLDTWFLWFLLLKLVCPAAPQTRPPGRIQSQ